MKINTPFIRLGRLMQYPGLREITSVVPRNRSGGSMAQTWEGDLPEAARARMREIQGTSTWGSALSTQEFNAIKSVGFDPVGQVLGTAVYQIGYQGGYGCSGAWSGYLGQSMSTDVSSRAWAPFSALVKAMYDARRTALSRAVAECVALGGDGIVGASL